MYCSQKPLFPPPRPEINGASCVRLPLFSGDERPAALPPGCQRVMLENPCRPGEYAEVILGVDECGSLVVCVRRDRHGECGARPPCAPRRCRH